MTESTTPESIVKPNLTTEPGGLLDDAQVPVAKPENYAAKTRKYLCGIAVPLDLQRLDKYGHPTGKPLFEFHIGIGPAVFCTETFAWRGRGDDAKQVFRDGAIAILSEAQVKDVQTKAQFRYIRRIKDADGNINGIQDIDCSDGGSYDPKTGIRTKPVRVEGRLRGDETPLKQLLVFEPIYENEKLGGRTVTVEDLKQMLAEAQAEEQRLLEGNDAIFEAESGRGGKLEKKSSSKAAERDPKLAHTLSTGTEKRKPEAGFIPG